MNIGMKRFWKLTTIVFIFLFALPFLSHFGYCIAEVAYNNLGFLQNGIWYSKDPFFSGDKVRIYSAVFNSSANDLIGKVEFFDNGNSLGLTDFSVTGGGKIKDVWLDFIPTEGTHKISAKIVEAKISRVSQTPETITITNTQTGADERFIDIDTDKDGVGNQQDPDDDNDTFSDEEEISLGMDPLKKDLAKTEIVKTPEQTTEQLLDAFKNPPADSSRTEQAKLTAEKISNTAIEATKSAVSSINNFAEDQGHKLDLKKEEVQKELEHIREVSRTSPETKQSVIASPLKTAYVFLLAVLSLFFNNRAVFYIISIFLIYKILKLLIRWVSIKIAQPKLR